MDIKELTIGNYYEISGTTYEKETWIIKFLGLSSDYRMDHYPIKGMVISGSGKGYTSWFSKRCKFRSMSDAELTALLI